MINVLLPIVNLEGSGDNEKSSVPFKVGDILIAKKMEGGDIIKVAGKLFNMPTAINLSNKFWVEVKAVRPSLKVEVVNSEVVLDNIRSRVENLNLNPDSLIKFMNELGGNIYNFTAYYRGFHFKDQNGNKVGVLTVEDSIIRVKVDYDSLGTLIFEVSADGDIKIFSGERGLSFIRKEVLGSGLKKVEVLNVETLQ